MKTANENRPRMERGRFSLAEGVLLGMKHEAMTVEGGNAQCLDTLILRISNDLSIGGFETGY